MNKMRERKYVKFKVDIYDDTKTKIIEQKPERDFIHYFFARCIVLAGKSDCEGELYMAKDIPYTIETLATEFCRDAALVKVALDVLIELKMIEVTEGNIYRVKSFVKHQNIKVKEDAKVNDKEEASASGACITGLQNVRENQNGEVAPINITDEKSTHANSELDTNGDYLCNNNSQQNSQLNSEQDNLDSLVVLEMKDNKKSKKKKKSESGLVTELAVDEIEDNPPILVFSDGDMPPLGEGERLVWGLTPV